MTESALPPPIDAAARIIDAEPARAAESSATARSDRARSKAYRSRFIVIYFALAGVLGAGLGALIFLTIDGSGDGGSAKPTAAASQFAPSTTGELGAIELAEQVQRHYRLGNGNELVNIVASRNTIQDGNLGVLRVRYQVVQPGDALGDKDSDLVVPGSAIQYSFCGSGAACTIPGARSVARGAVVRQAGLELAVRTFQHDPDVDNVAVFLGPVAPPQGWEGYAMVFNRALVERNDPSLISAPVASTIPRAGKKIVPAQLTKKQVEQIDRLTRSYVYAFRYQLIGGREAVLQLQPSKS